MDALLKPVSSYMNHMLFQHQKVLTKKVAWKSKQESVHKSRPEKIPTKKKAQFRPFPHNVRTLKVTGMLDGQLCNIFLHQGR